MRHKQFILTMSFVTIILSGCGVPLKYSKDFELTNINEGKGETSIELSGMGELPLYDGSFSNDILTVRKYMYGNLTIYYRLLYQHELFNKSMSPQRALFVIDGQRYILTFLGSQKSDSLEWAWINVEPSFLKKIADAQEVLLKIEGSDATIEYAFNKKYLYFFKRFYKECVLTEE